MEQREWHSGDRTHVERQLHYFQNFPAENKFTVLHLHSPRLMNYKNALYRNDLPLSYIKLSITQGWIEIVLHVEILYIN